MRENHCLINFFRETWKAIVLTKHAHSIWKLVSNPITTNQWCHAAPLMQDLGNARSSGQAISIMGNTFDKFQSIVWLLWHVWPDPGIEILVLENHCVYYLRLKSNIWMMNWKESQKPVCHLAFPNYRKTQSFQLVVSLEANSKYRRPIWNNSVWDPPASASTSSGKVNQDLLEWHLQDQLPMKKVSKCSIMVISTFKAYNHHAPHTQWNITQS